VPSMHRNERSNERIVIVVAALVAATITHIWRRRARRRLDTPPLSFSRSASFRVGPRGSLPPQPSLASLSEWLVHSEWLPNVSFHFKRAAMLQTASLAQLLVVTDFDATLTAGTSAQCHDLVGDSPLLTQSFREEFAPLLDWESNEAIDGIPWWDSAHSIMVKHGQPPRHLLPRLVRESKMVWRPGAQQLLNRLAKLKVPVLIVSAGLADIIEEFLRQHSAWTENITVCSNRLNYAADSVPQSVCPDPPITSFTKSTAYRASANFFKQHAHRSTIVVLGDSCSDIDAAENIPYEHLLSVGFLNDKPIEKAAKYAQTFDALVLGAEGSLAGVDAIVDDLVAGPSKAPKDSPFALRWLRHSQEEACAPASLSAPKPSPLPPP